MRGYFHACTCWLSPFNQPCVGHSSFYTGVSLSLFYCRNTVAECCLLSYSISDTAGRIGGICHFSKEQWFRNWQRTFHVSEYTSSCKDECPHHTYTNPYTCMYMCVYTHTHYLRIYMHSHLFYVEILGAVLMTVGILCALQLSCVTQYAPAQNSLNESCMYLPMQILFLLPGYVCKWWKTLLPKPHWTPTEGHMGNPPRPADPTFACLCRKEQHTFIL